MKPKDSKIFYEVSNALINQLVAPNSPPVAFGSASSSERDKEKKTEEVKNFKMKYEAHLKSWKEYQFERDSKRAIVAEKSSILLRQSATESDLPTESICWQEGTVARGSKMKPFRPPVLGKAYRPSSISEDKHVVVQALLKARKAFPKRDQCAPYAPLENKLFDRSLLSAFFT
jgi:hypothetical protein